MTIFNSLDLIQMSEGNIRIQLMKLDFVCYKIELLLRFEESTEHLKQNEFC